MINDMIYQHIFNEISPFLPDSWDRLVVYLEYGEASYSFSFYVKESGQYVKCYDLENVSDEELYRMFKRINKEVSKLRNEINGEKWSNMTMVVERSGKMRVDYDYTDLTEKAYQYGKDWKKKFLT